MVTLNLSSSGFVCPPLYPPPKLAVPNPRQKTSEPAIFRWTGFAIVCSQQVSKTGAVAEET